MAQQQPQNPRTRFLTFAIVYALMTWIWFTFILPRNGGNSGPQTQSAIQAARELEARGRWSAASYADQKKNLEQAVGKYEEYYNQNKKTQEGVQARFQELNVYNYLARMEGTKSGTHWYDQAETKLKDMEKSLHGRTGSVELQFHEDAARPGDPFITAHLQDPALLAEKLRAPTDPVSTYLRGKLTPDTVKLLDGVDNETAYDKQTRFPLQPVREALVKDLNTVREDPAFYTPDRFAQVTLSENTKKLLEGPKEGEALAVLNRALIQDAYPKALTDRPQVVSRTGDFAALASERLNAIRSARDVVNRNKITYRVLDTLVKLTGRQPGFSYWFALTLMVVVLKTLSFPFQKKQYQYQRDMLRIQPLIKDMQEKMKGRPQEEIHRRMMQIYKEENVNMAAGCLPMLVMMVVLFPMFWIVRDYEYQFVNAHFLWIGSAYSKTVPWLADNLAQFDMPLFAIYLVSTVLYSLMQPKPADQQQAQTQKMMMFTMPLVFGVMMWMYQWSSAFMLYWLILNIVSMYQSWSLNRQFGVLPTSSAGTPSGGGGVLPQSDSAPRDLKPMKGVHTQGKNANGQGKSRRIRPRSAEQGQEQ